MEHEERSKGLAEYVERRNGGIFEVMAYAGKIVAADKAHYFHCLVIPLPPDFKFPDNIRSLPKFILITENIERRKRVGKKYFKPLGPFLGGRAGSTSATVITFTGEFGPRNKVWVDEETFMRITKRNFYVDKYYADQIFNRGEDSKCI